MTDKIAIFKDEFRWLSNFMPAEVRFDGESYPTVENAYQAAKTLDRHERHIIQQSSAGEAKRLGKRVKMRPDWDRVKLEIMEGLLRQKYCIPKYKQMLITTGDIPIEEGNYWNDQFWGVNIHTGMGQNNLGKLIMKIREGLINPVQNLEEVESLLEVTDLVHFDIPKFLSKITPWDELIPALADIITVAGNVTDSMQAPKMFPSAFILNADTMRVPDITDRLQYREYLRRCYNEKNNVIQKYLNHAVKHLMESRAEKVVVFTSNNIKQDFVSWEVRRAVIGLVNQACKIHTVSR